MSFSGHADAKGIMDFARCIDPCHIVLVHGTYFAQVVHTAAVAVTHLLSPCSQVSAVKCRC